MDVAILPGVRLLCRARSVSTKSSNFRTGFNLGENEKTQQVENGSDSDETCCDGRCEPQ